ncbi:hypothetical protein FDECE_16227, partial [Fusarium decemcellulare]
MSKRQISVYSAVIHGPFSIRVDQAIAQFWTASCLGKAWPSPVSDFIAPRLEVQIPQVTQADWSRRAWNTDRPRHGFVETPWVLNAGPRESKTRLRSSLDDEPMDVDSRWTDTARLSGRAGEADRMPMVSAAALTSDSHDSDLLGLGHGQYQRLMVIILTPNVSARVETRRLFLRVPPD